VPKRDDVLVKVVVNVICDTKVHTYKRKYMGDYSVTPRHKFSDVVEEVAEIEGYQPGRQGYSRAQHLIRSLL